MTNKPAVQVLQEAIFASVCDAVEAFKKSSGGSPNVLVRDLSAVHGNTSLDTLPETVQKAILNSVQDTLKRLQREGYSVSSRDVPSAPVRTAPKSDPAYRKRTFKI